MMRKLCNFKKVCRSTRHNFACTVCVIKTERKFFQVVKNIAPHILLYAVSKNVSPVSHKPVACFVQTESRKKNRNKCQKGFELVVRNNCIERIARKHRKRNIDHCHKKRANHICNKKTEMRLVV